jgi:HSP20 family molecular chaperone IbpA
MPRVKVYKFGDANEWTASTVFGRAEEVRDAVRRRAFELFEERGGIAGGDLDDWFQAEKEVLFAPHAEVNEAEAAYHIAVCAPGFEAGDIDVIALPHELVVEGKTECRMEPRRGNMRAGGVECRKLLRRFDLTTPVEISAVTARIDEGILTIEAPKVAASFEESPKRDGKRVKVRTAAA